jgi:hypothetical protein
MANIKRGLAALLGVFTVVLLFAALPPTASKAFVCGYREPPRAAHGIQTLSTEMAAVPAIGLRRILVVNGSASQITGDVAPFWSAASYGQVSFSVDTISATISTSCTPDVFLASLVAALDDRVDFRLYQHIVYYASTSGCTYGGIGGTKVDYPTNDGPVTFGFARFSSGASSRTARHEFGHSLGLTHARAWPCVGIPPGGVTTCGTPSEYGGYGIMGSGTSGVEAQFLAWLGWIPNPAPITEPGTYTLDILSGPSGTRMLRVQRSAEDYLDIEYSVGVRVHTVWAQVTRSSPGAPLSTAYPLEVDASPSTGRALWAGETLIDQGTGTRITLLSVTTGAGAQATLSIDPGVVDAVAPSCTRTAPLSGGVVSGTILLAADASDDLDVYSVRFMLGWGVVLFRVFDFETPYETLLDTTTIRDGDAALSILATDRVGNETYCQSLGLKIINGVAATPTPTVTPTATPTPTPTKKPCHGKSWRCT